MRKLLEDVKAFHLACDIPIAEQPIIVSDDRCKLRLDLIQEEFNELNIAVIDKNIIEIADALADLVYVIVGMALEYGIPLDRVWDEVQMSNMLKIDPQTGTVRRREDGKILKPDSWQPPNIIAALAEPRKEYIIVKYADQFFPEGKALKIVAVSAQSYTCKQLGITETTFSNRDDAKLILDRMIEFNPFVGYGIVEVE